jgi:hypothetical protein
MSRVIDPKAYSMDQPYPVVGAAAKQAGHDILIAACPRCGHKLGVAVDEQNPDGRALCRPCSLWLHVSAPAQQEAKPAE